MSSIQSLFYSYLVCLLFLMFFFCFYSVMALPFSCDGELSEALCTSRAADPNNKTSEMYDQILIRLLLILLTVIILTFMTTV